ncbi:MAG: TlpA disulfide reductase family protein [bacterium]
MRKFAFVLLVPLIFTFADEGEIIDASDFTLEDVDGNTVCLDSLLADGPVFMSFWALWCDMCIKELDALKPYYAEFDSMGINLLAINVDKARSVPNVKPFAQSHKWKYVIVMDSEDILSDLYNVQVMPSSFIINQDKQIVFTKMGFKPGDEEILIETMRELFGEGNVETEE